VGYKITETDTWRKRRSRGLLYNVGIIGLIIIYFFATAPPPSIGKPISQVKLDLVDNTIAIGCSDEY